MPKYKLSKLYIPTTIASLIILLGYYCIKFLKHYDENFVYNFNFLSLVIFLASIILLILLFYKFKVKKKIAFLLLFFTLTSSTILSYDFILPTSCPDCINNIVVGKRFREIGFVSFLQNYHKPTLYTIKQNTRAYEKFLQYENKLKLNYKKLFNNIENETPNKIVARISKHSPLWFCTIGLWQTFFGDSYFSHRILEKLVAIFYLVSLYVFLGLFFKQEEYRSKLLILFIVLLLPTFLIQAIHPKTDLVLGAFVTWVMFFLLRNNRNNINHNDLLLGFFYSTAVLFKFTSLTLLLPISLYYLISFKHKAIPKLFVVLLSFSVFPLLLYAIFEYDMILNILTGRVYHSLRIANIGLSVTDYNYIVRTILYEQYNIGIPFVLLLITHISKVRQYLARNEALTSYLFIIFFYMLFFILRVSDMSRHLSGYLPLTIPLLVHVYNNCYEKNKMLLSTSIFLLVTNLLILINRYVNINLLGSPPLLVEVKEDPIIIKLFKLPLKLSFISFFFNTVLILFARGILAKG